jgi:transposase
MTHQARIQRWIADHYDGWTLAGHTIWMIAEECQVACSTVYRAINALKAVGAVDATKVYVGRQYISPEEISNFAKDGMILLTAERVETIARELFTVPSAVWSGVQWGLMGQQFELLNGGCYGTLLRVAA